MSKIEEKSLEKIKVKEKFGTRFINIIKKKWLISGTKTLALVALIVAAFILTTFGMQKLDLTPIDLTSQKEYTVSDESKEKVSGIEKDVNIYLIGYDDDDPTMIIAKQYHKANEKINVEAVDIQQRTDLAQKYGIESNTSKGIIVDSGEKNKVLTANDLVSYDTSTSTSSDATEEKLTSSVLTVTSDKIPNIYLLTGYSNKAISGTMNYLNLFLENEIMKTENLDILSKGSVPNDCNTLVITTPEKDFEDVVANEIIKYINNGGNILWLNASYGTENNLPNVNKVLAMYGVDPFSTGYILETDTNKMLSGAPYMILPNVESSDVTSKTSSILLVEATKINLQSEDKLKELKVESEDLLTASDKSFFRKDIRSNSTSKIEGDESGKFTVGAQLTKTIKDDVKSKLIIYGDNYFVSDNTISQNSQTPLISAYDNKDLVLNSIDYLAEREEKITIRKTKDDVTTYTATEQETLIIQIIIFAVPVVIIVAGIVVWQFRRRKK